MRLEEEKIKLMAENERLWIAKQKTISILVSRLSHKRSVNGTKKLFLFQNEYSFTAWYLEESSELQHSVLNRDET